VIVQEHNSDSKDILGHGSSTPGVPQHSAEELPSRHAA